MAAPKVRSAKQTKKTKVKKLTVTFPTGSEAGDLAVMMVMVRDEGAVVPLVTPVTNGVSWTLQATSPSWGTSTHKRIEYLYTLKLNNSPASVVLEVEGEAERLEISGSIVTIEKETYSTTATVNVLSGWEETSATEFHAPSFTTTVAECLGFITFNAQAALTGNPPSLFTRQIEGVVENPEIDTKTIATASTTTPPNDTKAGGTPVMMLSFAIAPAGGGGPTEFTRTSSETVTVAETTVRAEALNVAATETVHVAESTASLAGTSRAATETVHVAESTGAVAHAARAEGELAEITEETAQSGESGARSSSETIHVAESTSSKSGKTVAAERHELAMVI